MVRIERLIWDPWNVEHIARHTVRPQEVEEVRHSPFVTRATYRNRILLIGHTHDGRTLAVILAPTEDDNEYYVVTARPASRKERRFYREAAT